MKELIFCAEYMAPPVFDPSIENMGHVDLIDLGLSLELLAEIESWDKEFQDTLREDDPADDSDFFSPAQLIAHNERGLALAQKLQSFLGSDVVIKFIPQKMS